MTVVAAIVRARGGRRLCAGRRNRGGGRVRMHRTGTEALGQRLETISPNRRPATRYRSVAASSPVDPAFTGRTARRRARRMAMTPVMALLAAAAVTCLRRRNARLPGIICKRLQITAVLIGDRGVRLVCLCRA